MKADAFNVRGTVKGSGKCFLMHRQSRKYLNESVEVNLREVYKERQFRKQHK